MGEQDAETDLLEQWLREGGQTTLDRFAQGSPDVVAVMDPDYVVRYVNWTAPGLAREAVVGHSALNLVPADYLAVAREAFDQVLLRGAPSRFEMMYRGEHGVLVWVVRLGPILVDGRVIGAFTINTDVTDERHEFLDRDRFFSLSLDMLVVASPTAHLRRINPAFGAALGYPAAELVGRAFFDFVHPEDLEQTQRVFSELAEGGVIEAFENRYRRADGRFRVFSWNATLDPLTGDVYAVARDITEQRTIEAQLRHAQKMEAVGELAGGVAHDFNNLMQAVLANVELALDRHPGDAELTEHLNEIGDAGRRAAELTKQLLLFSRRQPLNRVPTDLNSLMDGFLKLLTRLLPESVTIDFRPSRPLPAVSADRTQLEQVLLNLSVNARDAMDQGGTLTMETDTAVFTELDRALHPWARPGHFVRLSVSDTGMGMSPEVRERAFEPFFTTKEHQRGTGLGLATVYGIVQQHGGLLHVYSEPGHGATFKVYLPVDECEPRPTPVPPAFEIQRARGLETILLAEDEDLVRKPVVQLLEGAGYRVLAAANGRQAVELFKKHRAEIALVLLDVVMPQLGGPEAWDQIRALRPDLPVIFTSGYADDRSRQRLPVDAEVLDKPFQTRRLLERVRRKLDG